MALAARAQHPTSIRTIGFLGTDTESNSVPWVDGLRAGLREFGYVEGKEIRFEFKYAERKYERLAQLATELVEHKIDVLVTHSTPGGHAAKRATTTIPIVNASSGDPVASGLVASLSRPGGKMTGVAFFNPELCAKRLELLKEAFPQIGTVAILLNPNNPMSGLNLHATESAAKALDIELKQFGARDPRDLESAFIAMANSRVDALAVLEDPTLIANAGAIGQLALKQHLPSIGFKEIAEGGGLIAYGVNFPDMFRQSARLIDKIFKGSKPSDLPVERVTRFEFVANLKTARAIGVTLPRDVADKEVLDAAIVGAAQSVEHYEIARYGTLIAWAESLGHDDIIRLLSTNLNEEKAADSKLSTVAVRKGVNRKAAS